MSHDMPLLDVNVYLDRWPFRRLNGDAPDGLVDLLKKLGIAEAWAGSFDAVLYKDLGGVNARLAETCSEYADILIPFGAVNPTLPDWEEDLRRCAEDYAMPGIRLHPNYHGYSLTDSKFAALLKEGAARGLIVQIAVLMEDERMMHPLVRVPNVDVAPLAGVLEQAPGVQVVLLNALQYVNGARATALSQAGNVYFDIATVEGVAGVAKALTYLPLERVLFGSHSPLFYLESAVLKLHEAELNDSQSDAIRFLNARRLRN
ncbi:MAG: hypothetical protein AMXMBFR84_25500 [Candidatus Hydrogenedentota bacterium]